MMLNFEIEGIEKEIMQWLDDGKNVCIESGAANDAILSYTVDADNGEVEFTTSACIFPKKIIFPYAGWSVDTEIYNDCLFVKVW